MKQIELKIVFLIMLSISFTMIVFSANSYAATKSSLKQKLMSQTSDTIVKFYYRNLDGKNGKEAVAVTAKEKDEWGGYSDASVWYISSDRCVKEYDETFAVYNNTIKLYTVKGGKLLAFETGGYGSSSTTRVFYFTDQGSVLVENTWSQLTQQKKNLFTMVGDAFDASSDGTGHTYNPYYFRWTGTDFLEYGGIRITEKQFKKLKNARTILKKIKKKGTIDSIYYRSNKIININYRVYGQDKTYWSNFNLTLKVEAKKAKYVGVNTYGNNKFEKATESGHVLTNWSSNVTYPKKFPVK